MMTAVLERSHTAASAAAAPPRQLRDDEMVQLPSLLRIPLAWVKPGKNWRGEIGDVSELAVSLSVFKQEVPIIVEQVGERRFHVFDGHRRRAALILAGFTHVDAILRRTPGDAERILRQMAIQTHSKPFEPIAEARALHELMWGRGLSREKIAAMLGRSPIWVRDRLALLQLTEQEQQQVNERVLPLGEALNRVRVRRNDRDGRAPRPAAAPQARAGHFVAAHPLAGAARRCCREAGHRRDRVIVGGVACGECWEQAIREDQSSGGAR